MIHNKYTLSIDRYVLCFEDSTNIMWIKLPFLKNVTRKLFKKFTDEQNKENNKDDIDSILNDKYKMEEYKLRLDILTTIYFVLQNVAKSFFTIKIPDEIKKLFKKYVGHNFDFNNFQGEVRFVEKKIEKTKDILKQIDSHVNPKNNESVNMANLIFNIQDLLGSNHGNIGKQKVYKLPMYIKKAAQLTNKK